MKGQAIFNCGDLEDQQYSWAVDLVTRSRLKGRAFSFSERRALAYRGEVLDQAGRSGIFRQHLVCPEEASVVQQVNVVLVSEATGDSGVVLIQVNAGVRTEGALGTLRLHKRLHQSIVQ